jgi:hypothetical protein
MTTDPQGASAGLTVKELLLQVLQDVRDLDAKLDGYISAHEQRHSADSMQATIAMNNPEATPAGKAVVTAIADHSVRLASLERINSDALAVAGERKRTASRTQWVVGMFAGLMGAVGGSIAAALVHH